MADKQYSIVTVQIVNWYLLSGHPYLVNGSCTPSQPHVYPWLTARVPLVDRTCSPNIALSDPEYY